VYIHKKSNIFTKILAAEVPGVLSDGINSLGNWGPNLEEFHRRFDPDRTNGHGPQWLRNLYFLYLLQLRCVQNVFTYSIVEITEISDITFK